MGQGLFVGLALMLGVGSAAFMTTAWPGLALALGGGLAAAAAVTLRLRDAPKLALFAIVAMVPLDAFTKMGGALTFTKLLFPLGFGLLLLDRMLKPRSLAWGGQCTLVAAFGLSVLLSLLVHPLTDFARHSVGRYGGVLLLFYLAVNVLENERDIRTLFVTLVVSCAFSVAMGMLGVTRTGWEHAGRLMGMSSVNPNTFATYLLTAALISLYFLLVEKRGWLKGVLLSAVFLLGLGIALSLSRAVALVTAVCLPLLLWRVRAQVSLWKTAAVLALVLVCLVPLIPAEYYERIRMLILTPGADQPFLSRLSFNRVAWELFAQNPILGLGPGGFSQHFTSQDFRFLADTSGYWKVVHNLYLAVACHMGIVGLAFFGAVLWRAFADLTFVVRAESAACPGFLTHAAQALQVALLALLLNAGFLPAEHEKYLWVLLAACAAMREMRSREQGASPDAAAAACGGGR